MFTKPPTSDSQISENSAPRPIPMRWCAKVTASSRNSAISSAVKDASARTKMGASGWRLYCVVWAWERAGAWRRITGLDVRARCAHRACGSDDAPARGWPLAVRDVGGGTSISSRSSSALIGSRTRRLCRARPHALRLSPFTAWRFIGWLWRVVLR